MQRIGIIVAMDKEFKQLEGLLEAPVSETFNHKTFISGQAFGNEIILMQCGIGKVNSTIGCVEMIHRYHPDLIISSGCAGGADIGLNVGDVVVARECVYHDAYCGDNCQYGQILGMPARFKASEELVSQALSINQTAPKDNTKNTLPRIISGLTVSGEWFVDNQVKMKEIMNHFPEATAVDMESCSIAQTCHIYGVPFISFRIISDVPLKDHKAQMYFDFWDRMAEGSFDITKEFLRVLAAN